MDWRFRWLVCLILGLGGCARCDLVEAQLRFQTERTQFLEQSLAERDAELHWLRSEVNKRPETETALATLTSPAAEAQFQILALSRITLGMTSGGKDLQRDGRDDAIQLLIVPHDADGDAFKCPGRVAIALYENLSNGTRQVVGSWHMDAAQLRKQWHSSLIGNGYQLVLPWTTPPSSAQLTAEIRFVTLDGRPFETKMDFTVSLEPKEKVNTQGDTGPLVLPPMAQVHRTATAPSAALVPSSPPVPTKSVLTKPPAGAPLAIPAAFSRAPSLSTSRSAPPALFAPGLSASPSTGLPPAQKETTVPSPLQKSSEEREQAARAARERIALDRATRERALATTRIRERAAARQEKSTTHPTPQDSLHQEKKLHQKKNLHQGPILPLVQPIPPREQKSTEVFLVPAPPLGARAPMKDTLSPAVRQVSAEIPSEPVPQTPESDNEMALATLLAPQPARD